jgi:hypothetical protein
MAVPNTNSLTGGLASPDNMMLMQMLGPLAPQIAQNPAYVAQQAAMRGTPPIMPTGTQSGPAATPKSKDKKGEKKSEVGDFGKKLAEFGAALSPPAAPQQNLPSPGSGDSMGGGMSGPSMQQLLQMLLNTQGQIAPPPTLGALLGGR